MNVNRQVSGHHTALLLGVGFVLWLSCGISSAQAENELLASPEQTALARATCSNVMRIKQGFVPFDACVESLSGTLASHTQSEILTKSYQDCTSAGLKEESAELASCILDRRDDRAAARNKSPSSIALAGSSYAKNQSSEISYASSNPEERRRKEEHSCAQLGLIPGSAGFGDCVARLDGALRSVEYSD